MATRYRLPVELTYYLKPGDPDSQAAGATSVKVLVTRTAFVIRPEWVRDVERWVSKPIAFKKEYRFDRETGEPLDGGKWRLAKGELQKLNGRFPGSWAGEEKPKPASLRVRMREEAPEPLTLTPGQCVVVELNENVHTAQLLNGDRMLVTYRTNGAKVPISRYYAHLRRDGVLEIVPGCVLRPKE